MLDALLLTAFMTSAVSAPPAEAAEDTSATLQMLAIDLRALSRIVEMSDSIGDQTGLLRKIVDHRIHELRHPRADGTFAWASLEREEASRQTKEEKVEHVSSEEALDTVTFDGREAYRVEVEVPRKRSLFAANQRIFVRRITLSGIGVKGEQEVPASVWIEPGDSWAAPLPEILRSGDVSVELGVESGREEGVAKVSIVRAKLADDPMSPYFPAVSKLLKVRGELGRNVDRPALSRAIDEAIATIPGELDKTLQIEQARAAERVRLAASGNLTGTIRPGDATPDVVTLLTRVQTDLQGTLEEQESARKALSELIEMLHPGTAGGPQPRTFE